MDGNVLTIERCSAETNGHAISTASIALETHKKAKRFENKTHLRVRITKDESTFFEDMQRILPNYYNGAVNFEELSPGR